MHASRRLQVLLAGCGAALCGSLVSCGGDSAPVPGAGDVPTELTAAPQQVDPCDLVPASAVREFLDRSAAVVSLAYGAAQVPTLACGLGSEFGIAGVTVQLAVGPVSTNVFEDAYGSRAGGDPQIVKRLGELAFIRIEKGQYDVHALINGSILSLTVVDDEADPIAKPSVVELARLAATHIPANPQLASTARTSPCADIPDTTIAAAVGAAPSVNSSLSGPSGSLMCSWASRPGGVVVTVLRSAKRIAAYRGLIDDDLYTEVPGVGRGLQTLSRTDKAGDLLVFDGDRAMAIVNVVPTAGFSAAEVPTTPGEVALATEIATRLLPSPADATD